MHLCPPTRAQLVCESNELATPIRCAAAIYVKNAIDRFWRAGSSMTVGRAGERGVLMARVLCGLPAPAHGRLACSRMSDDEKVFVRARLLTLLPDPSDQVAVQLAAATSKIARIDAPDHWPQLLPSLMAGREAAAPLVQLRALSATLLVLKELVKKRMPVAVRQLGQLAPALFSGIHALWLHHTEAFVSGCSGQIQAAASASLGPELQTHLQFSVVALRCLRLILVHGLRVSTSFVPVAHVGSASRVRALPVRAGWPCSPARGLAGRAPVRAYRRRSPVRAWKSWSRSWPSVRWAPPAQRWLARENGLTAVFCVA